jgi:hypothetical protein
VTKREQELVDQHRAWRDEIDARPEPPAEVGRLFEPQPAAGSLQAKILARRARRADDARLPGSRQRAELRCAWCNGPRPAGSTFCRRCEPHKDGILRVIELPKVEPVATPATFARVNRQRRSTKR